MEYISVMQFAEKFGISERTARNYCASGKIEGVFLTGKTWNIPADAVLPQRKNVRKKLSPLQIVRRLKQESSHRIWQHHANTLRHFYWSGHEIFWTKGYFVSSIGNVSQETIQNYIENQG